MNEKLRGSVVDVASRLLAAKQQLMQDAERRLKGLGVVLTQERKRGLASLTVQEFAKLIEVLRTATPLNATSLLVMAITAAELKRNDGRAFTVAGDDAADSSQGK